jgi:hypothetical protein
VSSQRRIRCWSCRCWVPFDDRFDALLQEQDMRRCGTFIPQARPGESGSMRTLTPTQRPCDRQHALPIRLPRARAATVDTMLHLRTMLRILNALECSSPTYRLMHKPRCKTSQLNSIAASCGVTAEDAPTQSLPSKLGRCSPPVRLVVSPYSFTLKACCGPRQQGAQDAARCGRAATSNHLRH